MSTGGVTVNGDSYPLEGTPTLIEFLKGLEMAKRRVIVERNGEPVHHSKLDEVKVEPGDTLQVAQLVGGG